MIRVSEEMKRELEDTRDSGGHTSLDSALRAWYRAYQRERPQADS